jgi:dihydropyrimidinase
LFDPNRHQVLSTATSHMQGGWHPFEGMQVTGMPIMTIARGQVVVTDDEFRGHAGAGQFLKRRMEPTLKRGPVL